MRRDSIRDWELAARVRAGEDGAFDVLMERYKRPVMNFVCRMTGDTAESEDLAQTVFVRAYRSMLKPIFGQKGAAFSTWLFQVARHAALDHIRWRRRRPAESLEAMPRRGEEVAGLEPTAAERVSARETGEAIAAAVARLPEDQRTTLLLSEYEGLSHAQIAAIMRVTVKSVEARLYRARSFLRRHLGSLLE